jgi:hypothetical protein
LGFALDQLKRLSIKRDLPDAEAYAAMTGIRRTERQGMSAGFRTVTFLATFRRKALTIILDPLY